MTAEHIGDVVALQRLCFPAPFPDDLLWRPEHLASHLETFPDGQFVAIKDGQVVGSASSLRISEPAWTAQRDWEATTGGHFFRAHDHHGETLYGADVSVHPALRRQGVGRALYETRYALVRNLGLARYGTACRIPGYRAWADAHGGSPIEYVARVERRDTVDSTLTPLLRYGLAVVGVKLDYMDDEESGDAACVLAWTP